MNKAALLIIDVQLGIFMRKNYDGMAIYNEELFIKNLRTLINKAKTVNAPVIYIQHMYRDFPPMEKGQPAWDVLPDIKPEPDDIIIEKHHADAFHESALQEILCNLGVTNLIITGLQTAYCVDTTCRRAYSMGYKNILVSDGHSTLDSEILSAEQIIAHHNQVLGSQFAALKTTDEVTFE
jgi:nicotinamidase-related amidase